MTYPISYVKNSIRDLVPQNFAVELDEEIASMSAIPDDIYFGLASDILSIKPQFISKEIIEEISGNISTIIEKCLKNEEELRLFLYQERNYQQFSTHIWINNPIKRDKCEKFGKMLDNQILPILSKIRTEFFLDINIKKSNGVLNFLDYINGTYFNE